MSRLYGQESDGASRDFIEGRSRRHEEVKTLERLQDYMGRQRNQAGQCSMPAAIIKQLYRHRRDLQRRFAILERRNGPFEQLKALLREISALDKFSDAHVESCPRSQSCGMADFR